jgi:hypothetical protein
MANLLLTSKYRRGTTYSISFPTIPSLTTLPRRVELVQEPYYHDVLIMEFSKSSEKWFTLMKTGVPIRFSWTQGTLSNNWVGYVSFIKKTVAGQIEELMEVHCVGATFALKDSATKVFHNKSIPQMVEELVTSFGFKFVGEDNGIVFEQLMIAGHSYWEWIIEHARRIGYGVLVDKMTFYFRPLDKLIEQNLTNVPVLSMNSKQFGINNEFLDRTLDSFKVIHGEHIETDGNTRSVKLVGGVDPLTSKIILSSSSPKNVGENFKSNVNDVIFNDIDSTKVSLSQEVAQAMSDGSAQLGRLNMPAKIACQGDPRIHPFAPILIQGTGSVTDGYWIASQVKHMFARLGDYQIEMKAHIDGTGYDKKVLTKDGSQNTVGVVNLTEALEGNVKIKKSNSAVLNALTPITFEAEQGWNRTPATWGYKFIGDK